MPCRIIFGETTEGKTAVTLDMEADEVGKRLRDNSSGWERFEDKDGAAIWVNTRSVCWVEDKRGGGRVASW